MKKEFENKVIHFGIVDTKKYRYVYHDSGTRADIRRIELEKLDTTEAIDRWEIIMVFR